MPHTFAKTMFSNAARKLQERFGSRASYERMANSGYGEQKLGLNEVDFIAARDSFYMATVSGEGWPYIQHRGGIRGFLQVLDESTLAFGDYAGNKQYISAGNLTENDRVSVFLMDYPNRTRLKVIGHARIVEPAEDPDLSARFGGVEPGTRLERILVIQVVGFDWNCPQHITPRFTLEEIQTIAEN
jgi:predicted pyridoxine 5'-phosphate oxidase superfamily flavin-nucleotide-binding protein